MLKRWPKADIEQKGSKRSSIPKTGSASRICQTQKQATECKASDRLKPRAF